MIQRALMVGLIVVVIIGGVLLLGSDRGERSGEPTATAGLQELTLRHQGLERRALVAVPAAATVETAAGLPLVFVLHGGHGNPENMIDRLPMHEIGETERFITVYPAAYDGHWNDGRTGTPHEAAVRDIDDVDFLQTLVTELAAQYPVDTGAVAVVGGSNGGMMAYQLACVNAPFVHAIAALISSIPTSIYPTCQATAEPLPVLSLVGDADEFVPFTGGSGRYGDGELVSGPSVLAFWATVNQCEAQPVELLPRSAPTAPTQVAVTSYECAAAPLRSYVVQGGGHTYPGTSVGGIGTRLVGETDQSIETTQIVWDFFRTSLHYD